jgi:hypothetical protein
MLAASSFDDIAAITLFSVFSTLAFEMLASQERDYKNQISGLSDSVEIESTSVKTMIGMSVFYVVMGFLLGMVFGAIMKIFNMECCMGLSHKCQNMLKFFVTITIAITTPIWCYYAEFRESQFILIIFYGGPYSSVECLLFRPQLLHPGAAEEPDTVRIPRLYAERPG